MYKNIKKFGALLLSLLLVIGVSSQIPSKAFAEEKAEAVVGNEDANAEEGTSLEPIEQAEIQYEVNKNLSEEQIRERFDQINSSYELQEPFSEEDTEFVRAYAASTASGDTSEDEDTEINNGIQALSTKFGNSNSQSFSKTRTAMGVTVKFTGTVYVKIGLVNNSYRGNLKAVITSGGSKINSLKLAVTNTAYGLVGGGGTKVGLVYNDQKTSSTKTKTTWSMDQTVKYTGVAVVYTYTDAYVQVATKSGTFNQYAF
ncbi:hypothetical protein ACIGC1_20645 [Peribacillus butanolivorans]|uniref:hypothetical protein n=1 Tax=Peribacillus butanolivorans TaxID=421767 RepID=UPI0037C509A6